MSNCTYLAHHGTKGQKWGNRRYQNPDGSLTPAGRLHYGVGEARKAVGSAAKSVGTAIRKKIAPTNAELNAQIRKQKSKNLNKQKRRELRELKRGTNLDATSSSESKIKGQHKRFSEMSDEEIVKRINRLQNEVKLAELEATKSLTPGKRFAYEIAKDVGKKTISNVLTDVLTDSGKKALRDAVDSTKKSENRKRDYESELAERKAKKDLSDWKKENPEGLAKLSPSSRKAVKEAKAEKAQRKADEKLKRDAERSRNQQTIYKEREVRAKALKEAGNSNADIAKALGVSLGDVSYYLYEKPKKDKG